MRLKESKRGSDGQNISLPYYLSPHRPYRPIYIKNLIRSSCLDPYKTIMKTILLLQEFLTSTAFSHYPVVCPLAYSILPFRKDPLIGTGSSLQPSWFITLYKWSVRTAKTGVMLFSYERHPHPFGFRNLLNEQDMDAIPSPSFYMYIAAGYILFWSSYSHDSLIFVSLKVLFLESSAHLNILTVSLTHWIICVAPTTTYNIHKPGLLSSVNTIHSHFIGIYFYIWVYI